VENQDSNCARLAASRSAIVSPPMNRRQVYRLRAPASGREALAAIEPETVYTDRESGEELRPITRTLPLAPSDSTLLRTPENLRICRRCDQLIGLDVSDCPYCGLRQPALDGAS
jgi:hypothetical protein